MLQFNLLWKWLVILLGIVIIVSTGYVFILSLSPDDPSIVNWEAVDRPEPVMLEKTVIIQNQPTGRPLLPKSTTKKFRFKNPFISPLLSNQKQQRQNNAFFEYQGIIETDDTIFGLVKINASKTLIVHEGQIIRELGIEIRQITSKTLTYYRKGREVVISLGGIKYDP